MGTNPIASDLLNNIVSQLAAKGVTSLSVHGPYEDAIIEGFKLIEKLVDGQSPEQKAVIWQGWINFWNGNLFK